MCTHVLYISVCTAYELKCHNNFVCAAQAKLSAEAEKAVSAAFTGEPTVENLYYAISTMAYTGKKSELYLSLS